MINSIVLEAYNVFLKEVL